jgi:hypothetical protein
MGYAHFTHFWFHSIHALTSSLLPGENLGLTYRYVTVQLPDLYA